MLQNSLNKKIVAGTTVELSNDAPGDLYYRSETGILARLPIGSDGQVLSVSGLSPRYETLGTASSVDVGNAPGDVPFLDVDGKLNPSVIPSTVPLAPVLPSQEVTDTTANMVVNHAYTANNTNGVSFSLPLTSDYGSVIQVEGKGSGGWAIAQNANQTIYFGNVQSSTGTQGSLSSTRPRDVVMLKCVTKNVDWQVISAIGNLSLA